MDLTERTAAHTRLETLACYGVLTPRMAVDSGFTREAIRHRIRRGEWLRYVGRTYFMPSARHPEPTIRHRGVAAALAWPGSVICFRTAAVLQGFPVTDDGRAHVVVPGKRRPQHRLVPHFWPLRPAEAEKSLSFRVTTRRRTALDCLARLPREEAESLLAWLVTCEICTPAGLRTAGSDWQGRRGVPQLRDMARIAESGAFSELERRLHALLRRAGITGWVPDALIRVRGRVIARVDVLVEEARVILEADGRAFHQDFERERQRLNGLALAGYTVLRFTWDQVVNRPEETLAQICSALRVSRAPA